MTTSQQFVDPVTGPCSCDDILDITPMDIAIKVAALRVSASIVSVITYDVPDDMLLFHGHKVTQGKGTYACPGSGIILQSEEAKNGTYFGTILTPANLFKRTNHLPPHQIPVHVRLFNGKLCESKLLECDFHYNLAAIRIQSDSPLKPATTTNLRDSNHHLQSHGKFGTKIVIAKRLHYGDYDIVVLTGVLREHRRPYLGVEVANLCRKKQTLSSFRRASPNTVTGVVVAKVEENSPAHRFGLKKGDVIIKWDGVPLRSKTEFFERVWDNAGQVVELTVVKASDGVESLVNIRIEETPQDKLYQWDLPDWHNYYEDSTAYSRALRGW